MSLSLCCRLLGISRQAISQGSNRSIKRAKELTQLLPLSQGIRIEMSRLGTRKLYYLVKQKIQELNIKIGSDAFNANLKSHNMLIQHKKNYTKTTNSSHWLRKHPNLLKDNQVGRAEQFFVSDITYIKSR